MGLQGKFKREGGRAGWFKFTDGGRQGQLEWEMLVGEFDLLVYGGGCWWTAPESRQMTKDEARDMVRQLVAELGLQVRLAFDGSEDEDMRTKGAV